MGNLQRRHVLQEEENQLTFRNPHNIMKNTTVKKNENIITGRVGKVGRGHMPHQSGAGIHKHKATKRNRTRSNQHRNAINDV